VPGGGADIEGTVEENAVIGGEALDRVVDEHLELLRADIEGLPREEGLELLEGDERPVTNVRESRAYLHDDERDEAGDDREKTDDRRRDGKSLGPAVAHEKVDDRHEQRGDEQRDHERDHDVLERDDQQPGNHEHADHSEDAPGELPGDLHRNRNRALDGNPARLTREHRRGCGSGGDVLFLATEDHALSL